MRSKSELVGTVRSLDHFLESLKEQATDDPGVGGNPPGAVTDP
jgi:hypothetical protein